MFIVDAQAHLWPPETPERPSVPGLRERMRANGHLMEQFTYQECLRQMDDAGVSRLLIVPPVWDFDRVDYAFEACEKHPDRFGVMVKIPQDKPAEAKAMLKDWSRLPGFKGTRLTFHNPFDRDWMVDGTCDWYWPYAEENGIRTMVNVPTWKKEIGAIARRHPGLKLIIDHMGILSRSKDDAVAAWVNETAALCEHPNIYVKVSAVPLFSTHAYPYANLTPHVRLMVDRMGPRRCFWGTDLSRVLVYEGLNYKLAIEHFTKHMDFSKAELEWIMGKAICECLDWPIDS